MDQRPKFSSNMTVEEFNDFYWYKAELIDICRSVSLPTSGTKAELNEYIIKYLTGVPATQIHRTYQTRNTKKLLSEEINPTTPLLSSGFRLNNEARKFFEKYFQIEKFSFKKSMAIKMRLVQKENDQSATVQDLIDAYLSNNSVFSNKEETTYQWNNFVRDFNRDPNSKNYTNKMKVAAILWKKVRDSSGNKKYRHSLIKESYQEIAIFEK